MSEIRPIRTEADYEAALAEVERLWGAKSGTPDGDKLDVLSTLIEAHEDTRHKLKAADPIAAIEFRMEQQGLTRKDLEPYIGSRARVSEVMSHKRGLSIEMIRNLHIGLGIPLESLISPTRANQAAALRSGELVQTSFTKFAGGGSAVSGYILEREEGARKPVKSGKSGVRNDRPRQIPRKKTNPVGIRKAPGK